jgi:hypothetical protein
MEAVYISSTHRVAWWARPVCPDQALALPDVPPADFQSGRLKKLVDEFADARLLVHDEMLAHEVLKFLA